MLLRKLGVGHGGRMRWLNYHHLGHFRAVAQAGGLTAAAKVLRIAPSTLSEQIKQLESALGQPLFRRTGRGLAPTVFGERVLAYADRIFGLGAALMHEVESGPSGPLRVGVVDALPTDTARAVVLYRNCAAVAIRVPYNTPRIKPMASSLKTTGQRSLTFMRPVARPRTTIVDDCVPIFPPIPIITGIKAAR